MSEEVIALDIGKALISSTKCCVPFCNVGFPSRLRSIPEKIRQNIMKSKRFFIPARSLACDVHYDPSVWAQIHLPNQTCTFSAAQIEQMVDLLRLDSKVSQNNGKICNMKKLSRYTRTPQTNTHFVSSFPFVFKK